MAGETRGTRPPGDRRLQGSWPASRAGSPPSVPGPPDSVRARSDGIRGLKRAQVKVAWRYQRASSGSPASLPKGTCRSQSAFCLGYREAGLGPAPPARLGLGRPEPSGPAGAPGPWRAVAGSGMRLVITFARPGRLPAPRSFSRAEPSSLVWLLSPIPEGLETASL